MEFKQKQKRVRMSILSAMLVSLGVIYLGASYDFLHVSEYANLSHRLMLAVSCMVFAALMLALPIAVLAYQRLTNESAIDGQTDVSGSIEINLRVLQNTLEQVVLAVVTWLAFALLAPAKYLAVLPVLALYFVVARFLFWVGYHFGDNARGFGFASTFLPSVLTLIYVIYLAIFFVI